MTWNVHLIHPDRELRVTNKAQSCEQTPESKRVACIGTRQSGNLSHPFRSLKATLVVFSFHNGIVIIAKSVMMILRSSLKHRSKANLIAVEIISLAEFILFNLECSLSTD